MEAAGILYNLHPFGTETGYVGVFVRRTVPFSRDRFSVPLWNTVDSYTDVSSTMINNICTWTRHEKSISVILYLLINETKNKDQLLKIRLKTWIVLQISVSIWEK